MTEQEQARAQRVAQRAEAVLRQQLSDLLAALARSQAENAELREELAAALRPQSVTTTGIE